MSKELIHFLDGVLLGDGCIDALGRCGRLVVDVQYREFAEYCMKPFHEYLPVYYRHTRTKGTITGRTKSHPDFSKQHHRWYKNGTKIVPDDVVLTPITVMAWFLGDGMYRKHRRRNPIVRFSTQSFSISELNDILIPRLEEHDLNFTITQRNELICGTGVVDRFFDFIGKKSPIGCYNYKFPFGSTEIDPVRPSAKTKYDYDLIVRLYLEGAILNDITQKIGCHVDTIYNALAKRNIALRTAV